MYKEKNSLEVWKRIKGYENLYEISNFGRVRNCRSYSPFTTSNKTKFGKLKTLRENNAGYLRVRLSKNSIFKDLFVHRLVAESFVLNAENKPFVNHKDGNKKNNHAGNLEWCTPSENGIHAHKNGLVNMYTDKRKESMAKVHMKQKKKVMILDSTNQNLGIFDSLQTASISLGYNHGYFSQIAKKCSPKYKVVFLGENE